MTLTLRIENFDTFDDGGPTSLTLDGRGASVGRNRSMDWVLPDPARFISGHHFDITFRDGGYFLTDVSSNGTYIQGESHRVQGEHALRSGERLVVGHYIIVVDLAAPLGAAPLPPAGQAWPMQTPPAGGTDFGGGGGDDPWDLGSGPLTPVNPLPSAGGGRPLDDMGHDFVSLQQPSPGWAQPGGPQPMPVQQPGAPSPYPAPQYQPQVPPPVVPAGDSSLPHVPQPSIQSPGQQAVPPPMQAPVPQPVQTGFPGNMPAPQPPAPAPGGAPGGDSYAVLRAFCEGAGIDLARAQDVNPETLARELGRAVRAATEEVMLMLGDRTEVKRFTRGGERTMRNAQGNNPMKFLTTNAEALEAMFLHPREGFMTGAEGFRNALGDLRQHQFAVFAALQPALAELLEGLSPDEIEEEAKSQGSKLGPSRRGRNWDAFTERWDRRAQAGENGMLDAFLQAFARYYAEAVQGGGSGQG